MEHESSVTIGTVQRIRGWCWGGFFLTWIWGVGNNTLVALLALIPGVNIVMPFVLGAKGYEWAWRNGSWSSVEEFNKRQKQWNKWAGIVAAAFILVYLVVFGSAIMSTFRSAPVRLAVEMLNDCPKCVERLGPDIRTVGMWFGSMNTSGDTGEANLSLTARGQVAKGKLYLSATKLRGEWIMEDLALYMDDDDVLLVVEDRNQLLIGD